MSGRKNNGALYPSHQIYFKKGNPKHISPIISFEKCDKRSEGAGCSSVMMDRNKFVLKFTLKDAVWVFSSGLRYHMQAQARI